MKTLDCIDEQLGHMRLSVKPGTGNEKTKSWEIITDFLWNAHDTEYEHPGRVQTSKLSYNINGLTVNLLSISDPNETFLNIGLIFSTGQIVKVSETPKQGDQLQVLFSQTNGEIQALVGSGQIDKNQNKITQVTKKKFGR
ncbi:hypothetical protein [Spirosoma linguale]|uniref:hypothetical protein n=1 Tax=Spirosoma linguale TaxID=108 RepID=UPI003CC7FF2C